MSRTFDVSRAETKGKVTFTVTGHSKTNDFTSPRTICSCFAGVFLVCRHDVHFNWFITIPTDHSWSVTTRSFPRFLCETDRFEEWTTQYPSLSLKLFPILINPVLLPINPVHQWVNVQMSWVRNKMQKRQNVIIVVYSDKDTIISLRI